jgi:hypothetical protein
MQTGVCLLAKSVVLVAQGIEYGFTPKVALIE